MKMAKEKLAAFNARCTFQVHCGIQNQVSDKSKNVRSRSYLEKYVVVIPKPSLKIGAANAICWNSLGLFRDYGLDYSFFRNDFFLFVKIEN